jgi:hypothetical protein
MGWLAKLVNTEEKIDMFKKKNTAFQKMYKLNMLLMMILLFFNIKI